jgi:hypothetical protein
MTVDAGNGSTKGGTMRNLTMGFAVLATAALIAPVATFGHAGGGGAVRLKIELPITFLAPTPDCPVGTLFTADYRISSKGKTGSARNCILAVDQVDCAPSVCVNAPLIVTFRLPGGEITARGTLFEKAPCDTTSSDKCTKVRHTWSGTVTHATGRFDGLLGATVSGGGVARYRYPPDNVEPFERVDEMLIIGGEDDVASNW